MINLFECDISEWVNQAKDDVHLELREAVHTVLSAIAADDYLKKAMILKGGILMAIRYQSKRFTKDIDFSTEEKPGGGLTTDKIRELLNLSLSLVVEELGYDLDCRVQNCKIQPNKPEATYPSMKIKIGYAYKGSNKHKKLIALKSPSIISIDYSLNESVPNIDNIKLNAGEDIMVYPFTDIMAEKFRSILQQVERNRFRRQDIFDLNFLIKTIETIDEIEKQKILDCLLIKSRARNINPAANSIDDPEIKMRLEKDYFTLKDDLEGDLPDFNEIFDNVSEFYKSLPW